MLLEMGEARRQLARALEARAWPGPDVWPCGVGLFVSVLSVAVHAGAIMDAVYPSGGDLFPKEQLTDSTLPRAKQLPMTKRLFH